MRNGRCCLIASVAAMTALWPLAPAFAQEHLDTLSDKLVFASDDGKLRTNLSAMIDTALFAAESPPQGLLFSDDDVFLAPQLSAFVDAQIGERVTLHGQLRADRGFDPGWKPDGQVRLDEYFVQIRMLKDEGLNLRIGKFATVFGTWAPRSLAWDNPLITAPGPYDDMVPITDRLAPGDAAKFAARRNVADNKAEWVPIVWGPSYATGVAMMGQIDVLDFSAEVKNASLSSRPETWEITRDEFQTRPTLSGRIGWRPRPEWALGLSFSQGPYLQDVARTTLPAGSDVNDFQQKTWGADASFAHGALQLWSEWIRASFDVPRVGTVEVLSGYIESKYKFDPRIWGALRLNQSWFGNTPGLGTSWDRDSTKLDLALGYRHSTHVQMKLQYSLSEQRAPDVEGQHLLAAQVTVRF